MRIAVLLFCGTLLQFAFYISISGAQSTSKHSPPADSDKAAPAGNIAAPDVSVAATTSVERGMTWCLIGLVNRSNQMTLKRMRIALISDGRNRFEVGPVDVAPTQSVILPHKTFGGFPCGGEGVFYHVEFDSETLHNELLLPGSLPTVQSTSSLNSSTLLGPVFGLLSGLIGGWAAHYWTLAREREKDRISRRVELFKQTEGAFRQFFLDWNRSLDAQMLNTHFNILRKAVLVDTAIMALYTETYRILDSRDVPLSKKTEAAENLERAMTSLVQGLNPY